MPYRSWRCTQIPGWDLDFFASKEWLDVQDRLDFLDERKVLWNPGRERLFSALSLCGCSSCNTALVGQDPYPDQRYATGVAFSVPRGSSVTPSQSNVELKGDGQRVRNKNERSLLPMSLQTIFTELVNDVGVPYPPHGCLEDWCKQGVLLWNSTPTCTAGVPGSHQHWPEWPLLTQEIIERLSAKGKIVFVFIGNRARYFDQFVDQYNNKIIYVSHPSPRGQITAKSKFIGSRLFSTVNDCLNHYLKEPIDWEIRNEPSREQAVDT